MLMSQLQIQFCSCSFCDYTTPRDNAFVQHMSKMHEIKCEKNTIVGRGENILVQILKRKLPGARIYTQVHLKYLVPKEEVNEFSERQIKETVDVLLIHKFHWHIIRVQHGSTKKYQSKGHLGNHLAQADLVQKTLIQRYHGKNSVIDLRESECKTLFKNKDNWYSESEVGIQLMLGGLSL